MEKVNNHIKQILLLALSFVACEAVAQTENPVLKKSNLEIEVEQSNKINDNPTFDDSIKINSELKYSMVERKAPLNYTLKPINAPKLGTTATEVSKLYNGFVKLGVVDFKNLPFAEINYGSKYSKDYIYSVGFSHFGSDMKVGAPSRARFTQTQLEATGKRFLKNYVLFGDMNYNYNTYRYYGSMFPIDVVSEDANKQGFALGHAQIGFNNTHREAKMPYHKVTLDYYNLFDYYGLQENRLALNAMVSPKLSNLEPYKLKFDLHGGVDWFTYVNPASGTKNSILGTIKPVIKYRDERLNARLAGTFYFLQDDTTAFRVYPSAELEYILIKDVFVAYAKYQFLFQRYDYIDHANANPFFNTTMGLTNTRHFNNTYVGVRGNISSKMNFNIGLELDKMKNLPLYVNDYSSYGNHLFTVITDDVMMARFYGQLSLNLSKIQLAVKGDYRSYSTYSQMKAWHLPAITAGFNGKYNFQDLIYISADVYYLGGMFAQTFDANNKVTATELPGVVDANIGIEYKYNKRLNVFLNVNNMLNKQYRRWNQYPSYGINFLGGLTYSF